MREIGLIVGIGIVTYVLIAAVVVDIGWFVIQAVGT